MTTNSILINECEAVERTLYFSALSETQQAEVLALSTEDEKRALVATYFHDMGTVAPELPALDPKDRLVSNLADAWLNNWAQGSPAGQAVVQALRAQAPETFRRVINSRIRHYVGVLGCADPRRRTKALQKELETLAKKRVAEELCVPLDELN